MSIFDVAAVADRTPGRNPGTSLAVRTGAQRPVRLRRSHGRGRIVNGDVKSFTPFSYLEEEGPFGLPTGGTSAPGSSSGGGFDWGQVFGIIKEAAPAIITAARGQGVPQGYYPSALPQGQTYPLQGPSGYSYQDGRLVVGSAGVGATAGQGFENLANSVSMFVTNNPLVVLGGVVGLVLLFKAPPSRR